MLTWILAGRGTRTTTTEVKLAQQLVYTKHVLLHGVFIDLCKAYDVMEHRRCVTILKAHSVMPKILKLIVFFYRAVLVCCAGGCYGRPFLARRSVTQGGPFSPWTFKTMVDAILQEWLQQVLDARTMLAGIGAEIWSFLAAFYTDV